MRVRNQVYIAVFSGDRYTTQSKGRMNKLQIYTRVRAQHALTIESRVARPEYGELHHELVQSNNSSVHRERLFLRAKKLVSSAHKVLT